ncbi:uncharacterized protein LOC131673684 [Phymastichus coffea]|uniref:uncharacterized protein LOC131673684 n=1 Tax=Phymastichus coffea TaxID=108790 RepID=UPI00273B8558|nr:uncharacterized protein LOC131673684 [Phymastichus coffea]
MLYNVAEAKQRVCVIGAGMSGLAAIKLLRDYPHDFEPIAFDKNADVGGMWIYTNSTDVDEHGIPIISSLYRELRVNLPKELMAYPDYQDFIGQEDRSYVSHEMVLEYLRNYTEHFNLRENIKFETFVEKVIPISDNNNWQTTKQQNWSIMSRNLDTNETDETICDAVMICNGHFFKPHIPKIPGIESFSGRILHSHTYRHPEEFKDKIVVLLGASASGMDIGIQISSYAKTVYLSHRHDKYKLDFPKNLIQVRGIVAANGSELTLQDGSKITVDVFMFCTGYLYEFAFLDESSNLFFEKRKHVRPLYKDFINVEHLSMALIGLPDFYVKGVYYYSQIKFFRNLLLGKIKLPSYEIMMEESKRPPPKTPRGNENLTHDPEWDYCADLAKQGRFEPLPALYEKSMELYHYIFRNFADFRKFDLKLLENGKPIFVRRQKE